jgi:hypothetical protein
MRTGTWALFFVQAVEGFHRASQDSEETDEATAFMRQLQWELDRISRDLVACGITCLTLFGEGDAAAPQAESARTRRWWSRCTREPSETHAVCAEQRAVLSSVGSPRRTRADVPLTALNCIVVFSATKVDKMVPAPAATPATLMLSQRPQPDGSEPQLASMLTSTAM